MLIVSACLLGQNVKYNGGNNATGWVQELVKDKDYVALCPETLGGLSAPRAPAEQQKMPTPKAPADGQNSDRNECLRSEENSGVRVMDRGGNDLTDAFAKGAERALAKAREEAAAKGQKITAAILKANSPSCGSGTIYDGTFSGMKIKGDGLFAAKLKALGIPVFTEAEEERYREQI